MNNLFYSNQLNHLVLLVKKTISLIENMIYKVLQQNKNTSEAELVQIYILFKI